MSPRTRRRILIALPVFITACAAFNNDGIYVHGNTACVGSCEKFGPVVRDLNSRETTKTICAAGAMTKECSHER